MPVLNCSLCEHLALYGAYLTQVDASKSGNRVCQLQKNTCEKLNMPMALPEATLKPRIQNSGTFEEVISRTDNRMMVLSSRALMIERLRLTNEGCLSKQMVIAKPVFNVNF